MTATATAPPAGPESGQLPHHQKRPMVSTGIRWNNRPIEELDLLLDLDWAERAQVSAMTDRALEQVVQEIRDATTAAEQGSPLPIVEFAELKERRKILGWLLHRLRQTGKIARRQGQRATKAGTNQQRTNLASQPAEPLPSVAEFFLQVCRQNLERAEFQRLLLIAEQRRTARRSRILGLPLGNARPA